MDFVAKVGVRESAYEELYVPVEKIDMQCFQVLSAVCQTNRHVIAEVDGIFDKLEEIFHKEDYIKARIMGQLRDFILRFEHEEKGRNLDQKM